MNHRHHNQPIPQDRGARSTNHDRPRRPGRRLVAAGLGFSLVGSLAVGLAACGGDDKAAATTTKQFCTEAKAKLSNEGGPFDAFFAKYPDPSLADSAEGLHLVIESLDETTAQIEALHTSAEAKPLVAAVLDQFATIRTNVSDAQKAAAAGDQAEFDHLEKVNQDTNVPAMMAAMKKVGAICPGLGS